ncbi:MAG: inositol monophosphatase family protein [Planifilum fulgidum]|jgi:myo-inositol-1(or 4)-monophosphatase|uniref:inositol monophosphatase family protein n=1 Tax=Planifilum fulgidum TaxID=201973 RepID=UPI000B884BE3|nr:inositol monophosphatase family protein [Planifilum fulgidum]MBO2497673.1 inositol monophosphatase [Bacillota bacterium]
MDRKEEGGFLLSIETAIEAAKEAGRLIRQRVETTKRVETKYTAHDLVTEVDRQAEEIIRQVLHRAHPDHAILGEEGVAPGPEASREALEAHRDYEHLWIVDPIDGTTNFVHGFPYFCVSIALARRGKVELGVIYDPMRDECFTAERGKGARLNGEPIRVSEENDLGMSLVATGFPADYKGARKINTAGLIRLSSRCRNIRTAGSAALHMAYVAAGRLTAFWELELNAWDLAAGSLLVEEAGGRVTDTRGTPYHIGVRHVLATNGRIHEAMLEELRAAEATGFEKQEG